MYVKLPIDEHTLYEIMKTDNISQGISKVYKVKKILEEGYKEKYIYVHKVISTDNLNILLYDDMYKFDFKENNCVRNVNTNTDRFLFAYDNDNKIILHDVYWEILPYKKFKEDLITLLDYDYEIYDIDNLKKVMLKDYNELLNTTLDSKFNELMEYPIYKSRYENIFENKSRAEQYYVAAYNDFSVEDSILDTNTTPILNMLHSYLLNKDYIKSMVDRTLNIEIAKIEGSYYSDIMSTHAMCMAYRNSLDIIRNNPPKELVFTKSIADALKNGGKTVSVVLKDGSESKVLNNLIDNYSKFRLATGYGYIPIEEIEKIKFRGKVILDLPKLRGDN